MEIVALTTVDNPYDPIDDFDRWFSTDLELAVRNHRRDTCSMLALFSYCSENLSEQRNKEEIERAINEIIENDVLNIYKKVKHKKR
jgi:hypothetical protein